MKKLLIHIGLFGSLGLCHAQTSFTANLTSSQEVPANPSGAYGSADFTLTGSTLNTADGAFAGFMGFPGTLSVNDGPPGINGPVLFNLTVGAFSSLNGLSFGFFSGSGTLNAGQIADLKAGDLYVNFDDSQVYASGETRGQIVPVPEPSSPALLALGSLALLAGIPFKRRGLAVIVVKC